MSGIDAGDHEARRTQRYEVGTSTRRPPPPPLPHASAAGPGAARAGGAAPRPRRHILHCGRGRAVRCTCACGPRGRGRGGPRPRGRGPVWKSISVMGAPDNSSLSHFSVMPLSMSRPVELRCAAARGRRRRRPRGARRRPRRRRSVSRPNSGSSASCAAAFAAWLLSPKVSRVFQSDPSLVLARGSPLVTLSTALVSLEFRPSKGLIGGLTRVKSR